MKEKPKCLPMPGEDSSMMQWALYYAGIGIPVFPIKPGTKNEYYADYDHRGSPTKKYPSGNPYSWKAQATTDLKRVRSAWTKHPDADIGGMTGDGLYVIDGDERESGSYKESIDKWNREGILPGKLNIETWTSITGSGGNQFFYYLEPKHVKTAKDNKINLSGDSDMIEMGSHIDTRGDGRYVVLPPSMHPNGNRYRWTAEKSPADIKIVDFDRTVEFIFTHKSRKSSRQKLRKVNAVSGELIPKGSRRSYMLQKAGELVNKMMDIVDDSTIVSALMDIAHKDLDTSEPLDTGWDGLEADLFKMVADFRAAIEKERAEGQDTDWKYCMRAWYMENPGKKPPNPPDWDEIRAAGMRRLSNEMKIPDDEAEDPGEQSEGKPYYRYGENGKRYIVGYKFAQYITETHAVKRIDNQLFIFRDNYYQYGNLYIENIIHRLEPDMKSHERTEIIKYLEVQNPDNVRLDDYSQYILCDDEILDWKTGERFEPSQEYVITNRIPWRYDPGAYCEAMDKALDEWTCHDKQCRDLLLEAIGTTLYRDTRIQVSFILTGQGANGKSTLLDAVKMMLGKNNVSELDIAELSDRFSTASLLGMLANIGDDISSDYLQGKQLSIFKKVVTGNGIRAEKKGQDEFFFQPYAKLFFSANDIPKMSTDSQRSISRRLVIIPFDADFVEEKANINIEDQILTQEGMEYLLKLAVDGLRRVTQHGFTKCARVDERKRQYERESNPLLLWADDLEDEHPNVMDYFTIRSVEELYELFRMYLKQNGTNDHYIPTLEVFSKRMRHTFGLDSFRKRTADRYGQERRKTFFKAKDPPD